MAGILIASYLCSSVMLINYLSDERAVIYIPLRLVSIKKSYIQVSLRIPPTSVNKKAKINGKVDFSKQNYL